MYKNTVEITSCIPNLLKKCCAEERPDDKIRENSITTSKSFNSNATNTRPMERKTNNIVLGAIEIDTLLRIMSLF